MKNRAWLEINLNALRQNVALVRSMIGPSKQIIAVVKANAYGLGAEQVVSALKGQCDYFAVANLSEALQVRSVCTQTPVLILGTVLAEELSEVVKFGFEICVSTFAELDRIDAIARTLGILAQVHLKVDTGMGRMGFEYHDLLSQPTAFLKYQNINWVALCSHLACADSSDDFNREQLVRFEHADQVLAAAGVNFKLRHISNSAGVIKELKTRDNAVRPGLMIYGVNPVLHSELSLEPVLTLKSRILLIRDLLAGATISYGAQHVLTQPSKVATISIGYADGYTRSLSNVGADVLINGQRCPILGIITMDMIMADVTHASAQVDDEVVLIGKSGQQEISVQQLANKSKTIPWEVISRIGPRVSRVYSELK
jgi:alanine racemase